MKQYLICTLLFISLNGYCQIGIRGGVVSSSFVEKNAETGVLHGPTIGVFFEQPMGIVSIRPELNYAQLGGSTSKEVLGVDTKYSSKVNYLEVPLMVRVNLGNYDKKGIGIILEAGPWAGYSLNGTKTLKIGDVTTDVDYTYDDEDKNRRLNYGLSGGIGVQIKRIELNARYNLGVKNITSDTDREITSSAAYLTLNFSF